MMKAQLLGILALIGAVGCRSSMPSDRHAGSVPLPTAAEALQRLQAVGADRKTIRAAGRVTYYGDKGRVRVRMEVVAERADRFRVATVSPFEQPIDVMTCDGDQLWLLSNGALRRGSATPSNVARLLPLPLYPSEIVDTLMGGIPTGEGVKAEKIDAAADGRWRLTLKRGQDVERVVLLVDPQRQVVESATIERPAGTPYLKVKFEDFLELDDGGFYPEKINMTMPNRNVDVRLKFKKPELNARIDPALFRLTPPPGRAVGTL